jgi:Holliday junction resolvase-like predicted endonuclease
MVEVKTRGSTRMGAADEAVSPAKSGRLLALGAEHVTTHPDYADCIWRVDLVAITLDASDTVERVTHFQNAFTAD